MVLRGVVEPVAEFRGRYLIGSRSRARCDRVLSVGRGAYPISRRGPWIESLPRFQNGGSLCRGALHLQGRRLRRTCPHADARLIGKPPKDRGTASQWCVFAKRVRRISRKSIRFFWNSRIPISPKSIGGSFS